VELSSVRLHPGGRQARVPRGITLLAAAGLAGVELRSGCGGLGTCLQCRVQVKEGRVLPESGRPAPETAAGWVLACQARVDGDVAVVIPESSRLGEHRVLLDTGVAPAGITCGLPVPGYAPRCRRLQLSLEPPTLQDSADDWTRLGNRLRREVAGQALTVGPGALRQLAPALREGDWQVTVTWVELDDRAEVVQVSPGHHALPALGLAVDIGTTTVVVHLVDLLSGAVVDREGSYNRQSRYGDDVITRIIYAAGEDRGLACLQEAVLETINGNLARLAERNRIDPAEIVLAAVAGNTTMAHLFWGLDPRQIRLEPYIPAACHFPPARARELGLGIRPDAWVLTLPAVASYVGGDIVAGLLYAGLTAQDEVCLLIDIGTNGEMVLGNREWQVACACSAGPAFEGGGIGCGTRAMPGAIERVRVDAVTGEVTVGLIAGAPPLGVCGSGLIDALAALRGAGVIDRAGRFRPEGGAPGLRRGELGPELVLVPAEASGSGRDLVIGETDIESLLRAKAAVFAGIRTLLRAVEFDLGQVFRIYIAGGFGNYLNVPGAVAIGLLPDLPAEKYVFLGNTSVQGARLVLLSKEAGEEASALARNVTYLELSADVRFMEEFQAGLFLPHTNLSWFPSVRD